jgi:dipeptidyl aminopeptidase/acylaminoacyl peptidase
MNLRHPERHPYGLLQAFAAAILFCLDPTAFSQALAPQAPKDTGADSQIASLLENLGRVRIPTSVSISPDGNTLAWAYDSQQGSEIHMTRIAAGTPGQNTAADRVISPDTIADPTNNTPGACNTSHPNWSPDGKQLAFLSNCSDADGKFQPTSQDNIFVWTLDGNAIKQVSHLRGAVSSIQWSPDGKSIACLYVEGATRRAGALDAMKPWSGVYGEDGVEVQRVWSIDVQSGFEEWLTPGTLHVYEFTWSPNSHDIAYVAAKPPGENNWWVAKVYTGWVTHRVCAPDRPCLGGGGMSAYELFDPNTSPGPLHGLQIAVPRFSPDGKQIAFIGGIMSDQGSIGGDIYVIPVGISSTAGIGPPNAKAKDITPNRAASPAYISWLTDRYLGVSEHVGGSSHITAIDVNSGKDLSLVNLTLPETIISGIDVMSISIAPKSRKIALIRQSFDHPPEVWAGPINDLKQITHLNDAIKPAWGKSESIDYTNDGFPIQGWLLYPANYDPAKKYPLIVSVHGGPSSAVSPRWPSVNYGVVPFSALGYFVFMPNPRGSYGQGEKFTQANVKDFGYGDLRDILAGVDVIEKRFPIDKDREGITGWSYGGFMTMFAVTQTTRFKAAVAGAGISDWQSYYGENSIDQWMVPFFGATVYDDPAVYAKSSAINFIKNVKTPTLIVVGDRDGECPAPQSLEFWHALREEGIKTQLVIYPNEGHHFVDPAHQRNVLKRALDWFHAEMPPK